MYAEENGYTVTQRPEKTLRSIRRKLRETTIRLGDMDDMVGCRITTEDRIAQDSLADGLAEIYPALRWKDRRESPSAGYRALHGILRETGCPFEIQIRTGLQDKWANLSESLADHHRDHSIKYGQGPENIRRFLSDLSDAIDAFEEFEMSRQMEEVQRNDDADLTAIPDVLGHRALILALLTSAEGLFR